MEIKHTLLSVLAGFIFYRECFAKVTRKEITVKFIKDFFQESDGINYNIFGCWSKKDRHVFLKEDAENNVKESSFGKDLNNIKKVKLHWLVADTQYCNTKEYFQKVNEENMFLPPYKHLILISANEFYCYIEQMKTYEILSTSEVVIARMNDTEATLSMIYKIRSEGHLLTEQYGIWTYQKGLHKTSQKKSFIERRRNFQKHAVNLGVVIYKDIDVLKSNFDDISRTPEFVFQQDMPLMYSLLQSVNATIKIHVYDKHGFRKLNKSTGIISGQGMEFGLYKREIDLSSTFLWTLERCEVFQPIAPARLWRLEIFLKNPSLSYVKNIYVLTLSKRVWIATLLITLIFMAALYVAINWEIRSSMTFKKNKQTASLRNVNMSDMLLLSFEALCQQGTFLEPFRMTGRMLLLFLFLMFLFVYVAYSANILVLLGSTAKLNTLSDLLESRFEVGGQDAPHVKLYFESPKKGILRELYLKKIHPGKYFDVTKGLEKVREGNFAFFAPTIDSYNYFLKNFTNYEVCALQELPGYMDMKSYAAVPKTSGYTEILKVWLLNINERGIAERTRVRVLRKPQCNQRGNFQPVRIIDCLYVVLIFIYGVLTSILVLLVEIMIQKYFVWMDLQYTNDTLYPQIE